MLWIWWPGFVVPVCMVLGGLGWKCVKRLPYRRKEALTAEQLRLARELMTAAAIVLQVLSTTLVEPAVQRSLHEKYGDTLPNGKEDDQ